MNIVTDSDIRRPRVLNALTKALVKLHLRLEAKGHVLPETAEITFKVDVDPRSMECNPIVRYYIVDHAQMTVFWFEEGNIHGSSEIPRSVPMTVLGQLSTRRSSSIFSTVANLQL